MWGMNLAGYLYIPNVAYVVEGNLMSFLNVTFFFMEFGLCLAFLSMFGFSFVLNSKICCASIFLSSGFFLFNKRLPIFSENLVVMSIFF